LKLDKKSGVYNILAVQRRFIASACALSVAGGDSGQVEGPQIACLSGAAERFNMAPRILLTLE
jgi:hypothetical protein